MLRARHRPPETRPPCRSLYPEIAVPVGGVGGGRIGFTVLATVASLMLGCPRSGSSAPAAVDAAVALPEPFSFTADKAPMLFSVLGPEGAPITADTVAGIPEELRGRVMVVDLSLTPDERQADKYVYFADLSRVDEKNRYTARPMSRFRSRPGGAAPATTASGTGATDPQVVLYSAAWCGFCKRARVYLEKRGVPFEEKDVEASSAAARELQAKLKSAGSASSGVPVIDIDGTLVMGFDVERIDALLARRTGPAPTPAVP